MARLLLPWGRRGQASAGGRGKLSADEFGEKQKRGFSVEKEKQCGFTHGKSDVVLGEVRKRGGVWTRWREKGRGVWAGCGEMFGFWRGAATAGVRDGGGCGRMRDGKCLFGAMISGGETWKGIFSRGAGCVL